MSGHRAGSDIVASLCRLRDRFHDIEPAGDRPLGARCLREPALYPNLNIFALGLVILASPLLLIRGNRPPGDPFLAARPSSTMTGCGVS
jgi:hypothetical protein